VNSSAVLTPVLNGSQLFGTEPGTATSDVLTTPDNLLNTLLPSFSVRLPATNILPNDSMMPQVTVTGFLDKIFTVAVLPSANPPT